MAVAMRPSRLAVLFLAVLIPLATADAAFHRATNTTSALPQHQHTSTTSALPQRQRLRPYHPSTHYVHYHHYHHYHSAAPPRNTALLHALPLLAALPFLPPHLAVVAALASLASAVRAECDELENATCAVYAYTDGTGDRGCPLSCPLHSVCPHPLCHAGSDERARSVASSDRQGRVDDPFHAHRATPSSTRWTALPLLAVVVPFVPPPLAALAALTILVRPARAVRLSDDDCFQHGHTTCAVYLYDNKTAPSTAPARLLRAQRLGAARLRVGDDSELA